jgi:uracil-DNA glycosylase
MSDLSSILKRLRVYLETDKLVGIEGVVLKSKGAGMHLEEKAGKMKMSFEDIRKAAEECRGCQLYKRRTNLVFGSGTPRARLMFAGEAPGAEEDLQGLPFVGRAGQLLTKMIEAINMTREGVYIANILKCRPPNNRNPMPEEIAACSHFLMEQIGAIRPKVICTLGKFASQFLLKSEEPITALRGKFYDLNGIRVMPTFHPAYLLRNPNDKRLVWEDLKKIRDELKKT